MTTSDRAPAEPRFAGARRPDGYELTTEIDLDLVHRWLSTDAYWALGRSHDTVTRAAEGSLTVGVRRDREFVAVTRAVTDRATFAWICDVYVSPAHRGRGLATWLVGAIRDHLHECGVTRLLLATADAHRVYARLGFTPLANPARWMELDTRPAGLAPP